MAYSIKLNCDKCGEKVKKPKHLKKLNGGKLCIKCVKENRKEHREFLRRDVCKIRKRSDILKEVKEKREKREKLRKIVSRQGKPAIPQIKSIRSRPKLSNLGLFIRKNEKLVLYKKLLNSGLDSKEASERVNNLCKQMEVVKENLRNEVKSEKELNVRFKEEFAKMLEEYE